MKITLSIVSHGQRDIALLDEGATVPFIARYRKEVTGNLDDTVAPSSSRAMVACTCCGLIDSSEARRCSSG